MDELVVSRNSKLYRIAEFGGFRESTKMYIRDVGYTDVPSSSCDFIRTLLLGSFAILGLVTMAIGMLQNMILGLIYLGLPVVAKDIMNSSGWFAVFGIPGLLGWCLAGAALLAIGIFWFIDNVWPYISKGVYKIIWRIVKMSTPNEDIRRHARDYLDKICKPVKITE